MDVSVVVTCWNGRELLEKNLPRILKASKNPQNKIKEILVVDDGSTDDSVSFLKKNYSEVTVVEHGQNKGYSATCNTGVREARNQLVAILNLDVLPEDDFLVKTFPHFDEEKVFAVSFNEGKFGPGKLEWKNGFLEIVPSESSQETSVTDWASGGSSIFRKKIWEELGGMDELFLPFYFEDIDLGIRARKRGFKCVWEPKAKVSHQHEATINPHNFSRNYIGMIKQRNHLLLTWRNLESINFCFTHVFYLLKRCLFHPGYLKVVFLALKSLVTSH